MAALSGLRLDENFLSAPVTAKVVAVQPQSTSWPGEGSGSFLSNLNLWTLCPALGSPPRPPLARLARDHRRRQICAGAVLSQ